MRNSDTDSDSEDETSDDDVCGQRARRQTRKFSQPDVVSMDDSVTGDEGVTH